MIIKVCEICGRIVKYDYQGESYECPECGYVDTKDEQVLYSNEAIITNDVIRAITQSPMFKEAVEEAIMSIFKSSSLREEPSQMYFKEVRSYETT